MKKLRQLRKGTLFGIMLAFAIPSLYFAPNSGDSQSLGALGEWVGFSDDQCQDLIGWFPTLQDVEDSGANSFRHACSWECNSTTWAKPL